VSATFFGTVAGTLVTTSPFGGGQRLLAVVAVVAVVAAEAAGAAGNRRSAELAGPVTVAAQIIAVATTAVVTQAAVRVTMSTFVPRPGGSSMSA